MTYSDFAKLPPENKKKLWAKLDKKNQDNIFKGWQSGAIMIYKDYDAFFHVYYSKDPFKTVAKEEVKVD